VTCPTIPAPPKPKQTPGKQHASKHRDGQSPFGNRDVVIGFQFPDVRGIAGNDEDKSREFAEHEAEIGEASDPGGPVVKTLENEGVGCEEEV